MKDITQQLYDLNEEFYKLFGRLKSNEGALVKTENKEAFANSIMEIYKIEAEKLLLSYEGEQAPEIYLLKCLKAEKKPRRGFFRRNRAMKTMDEQLYGILNNYFDKLKVQFEAKEQPHTEQLPETSEAPAAHLEAAEQSVAQRPADLEPNMPQPQPEDEAPATEPEISEEPATQSETAEDPAPPSLSQQPKKHKRGDRNAQPIEQQKTSEAPVAQSEAAEQPSDPLKLEEVPTDGGAQIRLQIL